MKERIIKCMEESGVIILENGSIGNLNSITFITMIISLETEFDIEIPDGYLQMSEFADYESVAIIINSIVKM